jgi:hypothetical protein
MYKEGRQMVMDVVHEVEGVAKDVKGVHKDAKGIFAFFGKLFGGKKEELTKTVEKPKKKVKQKPPEFDENLIYSQVADALTKFFQAYNGLKNYVKEQEELALHVGNEEGQDIAIKLVIANLQMEKLNQELSDYMVYHVPAEMKDLYSRVNQTIGHIANQQALARREELLRQRRAKWQRDQKADLIQNRVVVLVITLLIILWTWGMIISLTHSPSY